MSRTSKEKIDLDNVEINGFYRPEFWNLAFSNEGPRFHGVTNVVVHRQTGEVASQAIGCPPPRPREALGRVHSLRPVIVAWW